MRPAVASQRCGARGVAKREVIEDHRASSQSFALSHSAVRLTTCRARSPKGNENYANAGFTQKAHGISKSTVRMMKNRYKKCC